MPAYYLSVVGMLAASAYVFYPLAPLWLSGGVPAVATVVAVIRGIWWFRRRNDILSDQEATQHLRKATKSLIAAASAAMCMDAGLFAYADLHARYFIMFQMLVCAMCGFYCLMHLRKAAISMAVAVMVPFCGLMLSMHQATARAAAANCIVTAFVMLMAMFRYQREFTSLIRSRAIT